MSACPPSCGPSRRGAAAALLVISIAAVPPCAADPYPSDADRAELNALLKNAPSTVEGIAKAEADSSGSGHMFDEICGSWMMTAPDIQAFFKLGQSLPSEWSHGFDVYPCELRGKLLVANRSFDFMLNLGSSAYLIESATGKQYFFGCEEACTHLFPDGFGWTGDADSKGE